MSTVNAIRIALGVFGLLCGLALGTWAQAEDRYGFSPQLAQLGIYRCLDNKRIEMHLGHIPRTTRREALEQCTQEYLKEYRERVVLSERLIEDITRHAYPEAQSPAKENPFARLGREHREAAERVHPKSPILLQAERDLKLLQDYNDSRAATGK